MLGLLVLSCAQSPPTWREDVRPLLAERCLECHGPDEATRAGGLRLDLAEGLAAAVVPRSPEESELYYRVTTDADFDRMPPPDHGAALSVEESSLLRSWIEAGAVWEPHWAYAPFAPSEPPALSAEPVVAGEAWAHNPIDRFVAARLAREGLAPSPEADPRALIRRVHLDLTGLPPTEDELAAFLADEGSDAYERRVDELLASVHFAERFARHWLDVARYADSNGYTIDGARSIWPWRDWVVRSIHRDQPFDEFTIEQLAGDLLPGATREQRLATGFHRNTQINEEGGADDEENRVNAVLDRVHTTGAVWLGATFSCAQCHTHKFDPITLHDFYALYAFFDQTRDSGVSLEPTMLVAHTPEEEQVAQGHEAEAARLATAHTAAHTESVAGWTTWQPPRAWASNGTKLRPEEDGSWSAVGQNAVYSTYVLEGPLPAGLDALGSVRLEALPRSSLPGDGPGRASNGNFVLQAVRVFTRAAEGSEWQPLALRAARADFEQDMTEEGGEAYLASGRSSRRSVRRTRWSSSSRNLSRRHRRGRRWSASYGSSSCRSTVRATQWVHSACCWPTYRHQTSARSSRTNGARRGSRSSSIKPRGRSCRRRWCWRSAQSRVSRVSSTAARSSIRARSSPLHSLRPWTTSAAMRARVPMAVRGRASTWRAGSSTHATPWCTASRSIARGSTSSAVASSRRRTILDCVARARHTRSSWNGSRRTSSRTASRASTSCARS
jgi:hypothetical protein